MNKAEKYTLFYINLINYILLGLIGGSYNAALPAFIKNLNSNVKDISLSFSLQAFFNCVGNLLGTYYLDKFNRKLIFGFSIFVLGCFNIYASICTNINFFYILKSLAGIIGCFVGQIPSVWIVELFKENHKFYLQILYFCYSMGDFLSPLAIAPFLENDSSQDTKNTENFMYNQLFFHNNNSNSTDTSKILIPYTVMSSFKFLIGSLIIMTYFIWPEKETQKQEENSIEEKAENEKKSKKPKSFFICFIILISLIYSLASGTYENFSNFLTTFLTKLNYGFNDQQAAYTLMIFKGSVLLGRFIGSLVVIKLKEKTMIIFDFFLILLSLAVLMILGFSNLNILYITIFTLGFGYSSTVPLIFSYVEKNIKLTNTTSSIISFAYNFFLVFSQMSAGYFLNLNPYSFIVLNIVFVVIMIFLFFILNIYVYTYDKKIIQTNSLEEFL